jgi:uncharacterized protein (DUF2062 family)
MPSPERTPVASGGRRRRTTGPLASLTRSVRYHLIIPLFRSAHPPEHTARGVAAGIFWGVLPILGLQTVMILATWNLARRTRWNLSLVQALAWQWVNNALTMLPLYYLFYITGHVMVGNGWMGGYDAFVALWNETAYAAATWLERIVSVARVLGLPTLLGALPWAATAAAFGYLWGVRIVRERRRGKLTFHT